MLSESDIANIKGLSLAEVKERQARDGCNELPSSEKRNVFCIVFDVVREPMFLLLVICGLIYLILGDVQEALILLEFVFVVMGITIYQENKTEWALEALRDLSSPRALVVRGGEQKRIAGKEVVRDEILILREGDRVPADALLLWSMNLTIDESLLTGESLPVTKLPSDIISCEQLRPGGDASPCVFSGTLVVTG